MILNAETPRVNAAEPCLGEPWRRVLEDVRAEKWRTDPNWAQRRNETKLKGGRGSCQERRGRRLLIIAGADQRYRALMRGRFRIRMDKLVPLRQGTQSQGR